AASPALRHPRRPPLPVAPPVRRRPGQPVGSTAAPPATPLTWPSRDGPPSCTSPPLILPQPRLPTSRLLRADPATACQPRARPPPCPTPTATAGGPRAGEGVRASPPRNP